MTTTISRKEPEGGILEGYSDEYVPLAGYAALLGLFAAAVLATALTAKRKARATPERLGAGDILLLGVATHKLSRIVTKDSVTSPLRAPFTAYEESTGAGEVRERSRGTGLRRAVADLVSCPWCIGPWVAGALTTGWLFQTRFTRIVSGMFAVVTISDFLHHAYEKAKHWSE